MMMQLSAFFLAVALAGCAPGYVRTPLTASHPASPDAPEAPLPALRALGRSGHGAARPASAPGEMHHGH